MVILNYKFVKHSGEILDIDEVFCFSMMLSILLKRSCLQQYNQSKLILSL